jgi:hypothetical protein
MSSVAAIGLLLSQPAQAAPDLKALKGVWRGTIGNLPVHACYDAGDYSNDGKYFYLRRLSTIPLRADEKVPGELTEGWADTKSVARWRIKAITKNRAEGVWTGNGRSLPIRLTRLPFDTSEEFATPCGSLAFIQPIVAATRIVKSPGRVRGLAVEKWTLVFPDESILVESFQLLGSGPVIATINRRLREPFDKADEGWKWCLRNAGPFGADYHDEVESRLVTTRWLSVNLFNESFCGGAHPNNSNQPILFDRQSGRSVDLYTWFGSASSNREKVEGYSETIDTLTGKLFDLVLALHPRASESEEDCGGAVKTASSWTLELKAEGIGFTPDLPRVVMACGDEVVLQWNKLAPFLSPTGKREVAALRAELRP